MFAVFFIHIALSCCKLSGFFCLQPAFAARCAFRFKTKTRLLYASPILVLGRKPNHWNDLAHYEADVENNLLQSDTTWHHLRRWLTYFQRQFRHQGSSKLVGLQSIFGTVGQTSGSLKQKILLKQLLICEATALKSWNLEWSGFWNLLVANWSWNSGIFWSGSLKQNNFCIEKNHSLTPVVSTTNFCYPSSIHHSYGLKRICAPLSKPCPSEGCKHLGRVYSPKWH